MGLIRNNTTNLLNQEVVAAHGLRPEQAKQIIRRNGILTIEVAAISLRESPTFLSTTEYWVSQAETKCQEPNIGTKCLEHAHALPFYRKHDVALMSYIRMFWAQWREGL